MKSYFKFLSRHPLGLLVGTCRRQYLWFACRDAVHAAVALAAHRAGGQRAHRRHPKLARRHREPSQQYKKRITHKTA